MRWLCPHTPDLLQRTWSKTLTGSRMKSRGLSGKRTDQREGALRNDPWRNGELTLGACSQMVFSIWELGSRLVSPKAKKGCKGLDPWQVRTESERGLGLCPNKLFAVTSVAKWLANIELAKPTKEMIHLYYHIFLGGAFLGSEQKRK